MRHYFYQLRRRADQYVWWPLQQFRHVIHPLPLLSGLAIMLLLAFSGQVQEIYLAYLESYDVGHIGFAALALAILSAALFFANYSFSNIRIEVLWSEHRDIDRERKLRVWRNMSGAVCAAMPWLGLGWGLWATCTRAKEQAEKLAKVISPFIPHSDVPVLSELNRIASIRTATLVFVALAGVVVVVLLHVLRRNTSIRYSSLTLVALLFIVAVSVPLWMQGDAGISGFVAAFRAIGPLAMILLNVLLVFAFAAALTLLSRMVGFPALTVITGIALIAILFSFDVPGTARLITVVFAVVAIVAVVSWKWPLFALSLAITCIAFLTWHPLSSPPAREYAKPSDQSHFNLEVRYKEWLAARTEDIRAYREKSPGKKYPVFIIAAEGGGIYAATATAAFLSRLQDLCPSFAQHVFAISGVSGGAVGAAIFQSLVRNRDLVAGGCRLDVQPSSAGLSHSSSRVIQDDHLSPLLGFIVPDLLNTFDDRARGLEQSLESSMAAVAGDKKNGLLVPFEEHWELEKAAPALVLNATSVETGYRVAFAPFELKGLGGSLHSFNEFSDEKISLARAVVASARFPAILPAFVMKKDGKRLNLVDGGYSDSSGAFTALDIFEALKPASDNVEIRVVLLTSAQSPLKISDIPTTPAPDTLTPFITLLNVRGTFWEIAVARTISAINENQADRLTKSQQGSDRWDATRVEIDEQSFALALGWKISKSTQEIVTRLMGSPDLCTQANRTYVDSQTPSGSSALKTLRAKKTFLANSCVMRSIVNLLNAPLKLAD
jgi:hypothetical protein